MSNLGNKLMSGFYSFDEKEGEYLSKLLVQEKGKAAYLDPTCGEGEILMQLKKEIKGASKNTIKLYGCEIDLERSNKAKTLLDSVLYSSIENCVIENNYFSLVFSNPPYDNTIKGIEDRKSERKEFIELRRSTRYVRPNGLLIFVIPGYRFSDRKISKYLSMNFRDAKVLKFSSENYQRFKQCVFIGRKRASASKTLDEHLYNSLQQMSNESYIENNVSTIKEYASNNKRWSIPTVSNNEPRIFYSKIDDKQDYYEAFHKSTGFQQFLNGLKKQDPVFEENPILPISEGMLAMMITTGGVNGILGEGGSLHLLQGQENVEQVTDEEVFYHEKGNKTTKHTTRTKRTVSIKALTPTGDVLKFI
ncbi:DUF6094 domain-containing protein [Bacillus thuringiensis]|uniref:DUF6094 domain-containing protein n=1 Tax=Bacillus thuringiensis TaxID=1428 RepID=UPI000BED1E0A|nr:DUF6094 domain-containing protein [Bacillus thuringiensis]PEE63428.1 hypothetical protein COM74_20205 [Bacillus thuringiensis]